MTDPTNSASAENAQVWLVALLSRYLTCVEISFNCPKPLRGPIRALEVVLRDTLSADCAIVESSRAQRGEARLSPIRLSPQRQWCSERAMTRVFVEALWMSCGRTGKSCIAQIPFREALRSQIPFRNFSQREHKRHFALLHDMVQAK